MADPIRVEKVKLHSPPLDELCGVLEKSLLKSFANVKVSVVDCPDLSAQPYMLAAQGICGNARVADIGGTSYIMPTPELDKVYNLEHVPEWTDIKGRAFVVGAAGTVNSVDNNLSEMIPNLSFDENKQVNNQTRTCRIDHQNGGYKLELLTADCIARHLATVYVSEGKSGKVIEIRANNRTGSLDFIKSLQLALKEEYNTHPVALGGVFMLTKGKANIHIMPRYSPTPLTCKEDVDNWLTFVEMSSPLIVMGYLISHDPGLKLRMEHFHCFSHHGDGGHFHYDTTPQDAEYVAYFNVPEYLYRIDRWNDDHHTVNFAE